MQHTQFLVFEISPTCNLAASHAPACPSANPERWAHVDTARPITDDLIVDCCQQAYDRGFRGQVAWHYYCEPMLEWDRLQVLMFKIRAEIPEAKFCLWTNGTLWPQNLSELRVFETIWISNYAGRDWGHIRGVVSDTRIQSGVLDHRAVRIQAASTNRCLRPYNEFIVDHYGNGRICCIDWRGEVSLGNVWSGFMPVFEKYRRIRDGLTRTPIAEGSPEPCKNCVCRGDSVGRLVLDVAADIESKVQQ